jgi:hypothetical protein
VSVQPAASPEESLCERIRDLSSPLECETSRTIANRPRPRKEEFERFFGIHEGRLGRLSCLNHSRDGFPIG